MNFYSRWHSFHYW